jgi:hypothetical protein
MPTDVNRARLEITTSSAAGSPFLIAFGLTILLTGLAAFVLPTKTAALILLFQGNAALPLAFWLERRLGWGTMSPGNPLKALSIQLAMSQIAAFPVVILAYALAPWSVGAAMAAVAGGHFVPYAWLQGTRIYIVLGAAVSIGGLVLTLVLREGALPWTLVFMGVVYWLAAVGLYRHAAAMARREGLVEGGSHAPAAA